jgi:hypothetical protein
MKINYPTDPRFGNTGLDDGLTDSNKAISPTHRQCSSPQKIMFVLLVLISGKGFWA